MPKFIMNSSSLTGMAWLSCVYSIFLTCPAFAQTATPAPEQSNSGAEPTSAVPSAGVEEIIVTAQKREQSINSAGLTIVSLTGESLELLGIKDTGDLTKIVPGFTYTTSPYATPVYTLRGIGLYDYGFASAPSVAVYLDQVPLPYPSMTIATGLDLKRVEVLKGPQGTLFGQSATGGAINYIPNLPTKSMKAGTRLEYDSDGKIEVSGFVSAPVTETLGARLAIDAVKGGAWQSSISRPRDKLGDKDKLTGRIILEWEPNSRFHLTFTGTGNRDWSDNEAGQVTTNTLNVYGTPAQATASGNPYAIVNPTLYQQLTTPGLPGRPAAPNYDPSYLARQATTLGRFLRGEPGAAAILGTSNPGNRAAKAEWNPDYPVSNNNRLGVISLRTDYSLTDSLKLTSIGSYSSQSISSYVDNDATVASANNDQVRARVDYKYSELRGSLDTSRFHGIIGLNYGRTDESDTVVYNLGDASTNEALPGLRFSAVTQDTNQVVDDYSIFAHGEYEVLRNLNIRAGIRYNESKRKGSVCVSDTSASQTLSKTFGNIDIVPGFGYYDLQSAFGLPIGGHVVVKPGDCTSLNAITLRPSIVPFKIALDENNAPWDVGFNYKLNQGTLIYATVSTGYKSGIISGLSAATTAAFLPAKQEKLVAYEAGLKASLLNHRVQFNAAGFIYDYDNKQVRARVLDPIFGLLEELMNVPRSRVYGGEIELIAAPARGLSFSLRGAYLHSEVTGDFQDFGGLPVYNQAGYTGNFKGSALPYTPRISTAAEASYEYAISKGVVGRFGGNITYNGSTNTTFYNRTLLASDYAISSYTLLDLRVGISASDQSWDVTLYCHNCTNTYYVTHVFTPTDITYRYAGHPRAFGAALSLRIP